MKIRPNTPRTIALIACLGTAFAIGGCGDGDGTTPPTPALLGVLDGGCAEIPPGAAGGFRLLPHPEVGVRVAAAWPSADLVVKANNGPELERVGPSDTARQSALEAAGTGYWVPQKIDPNPTPPAWTVGVKLPPSMRAAPNITLELVSRTPGGQSSDPLTVDIVKDINAVPRARRVRLDWRDRGDEAGYLLERKEGGELLYTTLASPGANAATYTDKPVKPETSYSYRLTAHGCGPLVPPPPATGGQRIGISVSKVDVTTLRPTTGVETISLSRSPDPADDQFVYTNPLNIFLPEDAIVTNVKNVALDVNNDVAVPLELVRHTDATGSRSLPATTCPTVPLAPGASTPLFNGQTVQGEWSVRATCISKTLLRDFLRLEIAWSE